MSRTGNKIIQYPENVSIDISEGNILVNGPKGSLTVPNFTCLKILMENNTLKISKLVDDKSAREKHGLLRTLINNAIIGVSQGYQKKMNLKGIGYRVQLKGSNLEFSLGYSHPVTVPSTEGIEFKVEGQNVFYVNGIDKELIGRTCASIKKLRKKDSYKGKGIFFENEVIKKKQGKSVKK